MIATTFRLLWTVARCLAWTPPEGVRLILTWAVAAELVGAHLVRPCGCSASGRLYPGEAVRPRLDALAARLDEMAAAAHGAPGHLLDTAAMGEG